MNMKVLSTALLAACVFSVWMFVGPASAEEYLEAKDIWTEFQQDQAGAEARYSKGRILVTGIVVETGMSRYATPNVRLSDEPGGQVYVICVLPRADFPKLSSFSKGRRATLSGEYRHNRSGPVVIKECRSE